ncbi:transcriptional regulator family: UAF complex subunit Rrn10 [Penicillium psychrosexuale]|uniref:transcriptional regulator family: UAF complex subunit Rrn10 n=1 Tax=Penicillium psychrosexuale TaxID=1002107 RepID=UPI0025452BCC|nr:transcriptional regulator family: UAF complex subunit Rrn10 [Penicillium psychrosexuale]KAJ5790434.1 transcriptional regulator family: UAF complex subunit Rrn10 [Penicillium psychrosexuale]
MHLRPDHAVRDLPTLHAFIEQHPLGVLTTSLPSDNHPTLQCSHIPWVLDSKAALEPELAKEARVADGSTSASPYPSLGVLRGHIARQNPQSKAMVESALEYSTKTTSIPGAFPITNSAEEPPASTGYTLPAEVLIVFTSPVDHYITPNFYTESKPATGRVAPTWNYAAVQVYGRATIYHDAEDEQTELFLRQQLGDLARLGEEGVMGFQDESGFGSGSASASGPNVKHGGGETETENGDEEGDPPHNLTQNQNQNQGQRQNLIPDIQLNQGSKTATGAGGHGDIMPLPRSTSAPWKIADAPLEYIAALLKNIVGMRIEITRIEGRFKVSQERPVNDRGGVVHGLESMGGRARDMADFVRRGKVLPGK